MFWRMVKRSFWQSQRRTRVAVAALTLAAAVTSALINLYFDARAKVSREFHRYGANLLVTPTKGELLEEALAEELKVVSAGRITTVLPYLYAVAQFNGESVVLAGTYLHQASALRATAELEGEWPENSSDRRHCLVGASVAAHFQLGPGSRFAVDYRGVSRELEVAGIMRTGGPEDSQVLVPLPVVQELTHAPGRASALLVRAAGGPAELDALARELSRRFSIQAKALREIAESEVRVLTRIRGMLWATTAVVLLLTAVCVLSTMMTLAIERRREIGLLKALGGSGRDVRRLFLAEAALLALPAGLLGAGLGLALSQWLGQAVFASAVSLRWVTLPAAVAVALAVAVAGTLAALQLAGRAEPAVILRGE